MKQTALLIVILATTLSIHAQVTDARQEALLMKDELSLTDEQYAKIHEVLTAHYESVGESRDATAAWESNESYMDSLKIAKADKFRDILTDEQFARWKKSGHESDSETDYRQQAIDEANEMQTKLELTAQQRNQLEDLTFQHLQYLEKKRDIQRGSGQLQPRVFLRAQSAYGDAVSRILSKEQFQKWQEISE